MFTPVIDKLSQELSDIKDVICWQENLRGTVYNQIGTSAPITLSVEALLAVQKLAPSKFAWQLFDHCAAVSRVYGLFEQAVNELVLEYIKFIPLATPKYSDLLEDTRVQYRLGVAQILLKWKSSKSLYSHLSEEVITAGLADGLRSKGYTLLGDAFLIDTDNYRTDTINRIFQRLGFENAFAGVKKSTSIVKFCSNLGSQSADSYLNEFVRVRNESAHGNVGTISSSKEILSYAEFVELVIKELASLLITRMIRDGVAAGHSKLVGTVLRKFSNRIVGVSSGSDMTIKNGDILYGGKKQIESVSVVSLRIHDTDHSELHLHKKLEFGLGLDKDIPIGAELYRLE